jgi:protein SCO1/2
MSRRAAFAAIPLLLFAALLPVPAHAASEAAEVEAKPVAVKLPDLELLDQDGNRVRFRSDVVKDRIVVIDVLYTTCPLVCPILSAVFADLQDALGTRLGADVFLVSVSVDPVTDIPPRLKEFAGRWEARPGWTFLTGQKIHIDRVLEGLGAYTPDFTDHPAMIWSRMRERLLDPILRISDAAGNGRDRELTARRRGRRGCEMTGRVSAMSLAVLLLGFAWTGGRRTTRRMHLRPRPLPRNRPEDLDRRPPSGWTKGSNGNISPTRSSLTRMGGRSASTPTS